YSFSCFRNQRNLHSFPTRRSSDLKVPPDRKKNGRYKLRKPELCLHNRLRKLPKNQCRPTSVKAPDQQWIDETLGTLKKTAQPRTKTGMDHPRPFCKILSQIQ